MKLKIDRVKSQNLTSQLTKMGLMGNEVYFILEGDKFKSDVYLPTKDVVKSSKLQLSDVFETVDKLDKPLRLGFLNGSKVRGVLSYFDLPALHAEIDYIEDGEDQYLADSLTLKDNTLKIKLSCLDPTLGFTNMSDEQLTTVFDDSSKVYKFNLSSTDLEKISNLNRLDQSKLFSIYADSQGVHVKGDQYDIIVDDSVTEAFPEVLIFKTFIPRIDKESYNVTVCQGAMNKIILESSETETKIALNLALRPE